MSELSNCSRMISSGNRDTQKDHESFVVSIHSYNHRPLTVFVGNLHVPKRRVVAQPVAYAAVDKAVRLKIMDKIHQAL
jgi:hypothetical protein